MTARADALMGFTVTGFRPKGFTLVGCALVGWAATPLAAQEALLDTRAGEVPIAAGFNHALNVCPIAPVFGVFSVNYEHRLHPSYGVVVRLDYEAVPSTYSEADIEASGAGVMLNVRRHLSPSMASMFVGVYARHRVFSGTGVLGAAALDTRLSEQTVGLNIGKRWVWDSGFNVTFGLGYGVSTIGEETAPAGAPFTAAVAVFRDEYTFLNPHYGELSIGFAF
jgi:hypothetical protein